jgi:DNA-binding beta-propeller fold protein YncE
MDATWGIRCVSSHFLDPFCITVGRQGDLYVSDASERVQEFSADSVFVRQWGSQGTGNGQFMSARGLAVDGDNNVYVTDSSFLNRVQVFSESGGYLTQFGNTGTGDGQFQQPVGVSLDSEGNVYVLDTANNRVQKFGPAVVPTTKTTWGALKARFR